MHLEKFVELRSYLFFKENETMLLPILDMFYLWNIFPMIQKNPDIIRPFYEDIQEALKIYSQESELTNTIIISKISFNPINNSFFADEDEKHRYYYLIFFKGVCLRYLGALSEAITCFREVIAW